MITFRVKVYSVQGNINAHTKESENIVIVRRWAKNLRKHYPNHCITIQRKGIWDDYKWVD